MSESPADVPSRSQPPIPVGALLLRPWRTADREQVLAAFRDRAIRGWSGCRIDSLDEATSWISRWTMKWTERSAASWAVVAKDNPRRVLGQVGLRTLWVGEMGEISYWVMPDQRGRGIAPEATRALAEWAIEYFCLTRLEIVHSVRNRASCRVALKAGFAPEGIERSLQRHEDSGVHDMHLHAMVRPAETRARPLDRALVGVVSHVTLWTTASVLSAGLAMLTLISRFAAALPLLLAAGVLGLRAGTVRWPRRRHERCRARQDAS
jgi:RimJ/RimL family protein N-acetyltransferase